LNWASAKRANRSGIPGRAFAGITCSHRSLLGSNGAITSERPSANNDAWSVFVAPPRWRWSLLNGKQS
jgi:hypothetical protein